MTQTICDLQSLDLTEHLLTPNLQHTEESTDKLLQLIKLIQGCQKQKDELEKKASQLAGTRGLYPVFALPSCL